MRSLIAALPLLALTACGGASGPESVGSVAPPAGSGGSGGTGGSVTPTPSPTPTPTPTPTHFLSIAAAKTFDAVGSFHSLQRDGTTGGVLYRGNASTVRTPSGTVNYDPRDGIFTINFVDDKAGIATADFRYQDPVHRTELMNFATPAYGVPALADFNYLQAVGPANAAETIDRVTFFYQRPGSSAYHVSLAGYVRNTFPVPGSAGEATAVSTYERGAMVFGDQTARAQIPVSGTGTYTGGLLATMVANSNYFQWISGTSQVSIDFGRATMSMLLTGTVDAAYTNGIPAGTGDLFIPTGAVFSASGSGTIDLVRNGGFTGQFNSVTFTAGTTTSVVYEPVNPSSPSAGANSIDGAFFGPSAVNVGGNFRIIGGLPGQRVDILGAFAGAKQ